VIYLVSSLMLRSALGGLYVVSPIVATVAILFGVLGWIGIRLDMGSASVIAMAAGIGADYAIYFLYRLREEHARAPTDEAAFDAALHTSGRAVLFVAASIGAGFSVMGFSKFLGMRLFGTLMPIAMAVSCLAALSLMPVLVLRTRPAFVFGRAAKEAAGRGTPPRAFVTPRNMKRRKPIACLLSACRRPTCGTRAGPNSAAGRRGRRRSAYEAPRAVADRGTRLSGAESKRRWRPRLPARPSRVTLLAGRLRRAGRPAPSRSARRSGGGSCSSARGPGGSGRRGGGSAAPTRPARPRDRHTRSARPCRRRACPTPPCCGRGSGPPRARRRSAPPPAARWRAYPAARRPTRTRSRRGGGSRACARAAPPPSTWPR